MDFTFMVSNSGLSCLDCSGRSDLKGQHAGPRGSGVDRIRSLSENLTDFSVAVDDVIAEETLSLE